MRRKNPMTFSYANLTKWLHIAIPKIWEEEQRLGQIYPALVEQFRKIFYLHNHPFRYIGNINLPGFLYNYNYLGEMYEHIINKPIQHVINAYIEEFVWLLRYPKIKRTQMWRDYNPSILSIFGPYGPRTESDINNVLWWLSADPAAFGIGHIRPIGGREVEIALGLIRKK